MKKIFKSILVFIILTLFITACSNNDNNAEINDSKDVDIKDNSTESIEIGGVSDANPIKADKDEKSVTIYATVNGKFFKEPTRHAIIYKDGKFSDMSIFKSSADQMTFYENLNDIGAESGDNLNMDNAANTKVEGSRLKVNVSWKDSEDGYDINKCIIDSNGMEIDMRFGGNIEAAKEYNTGCVACLDSCPVGIVSNHSYTLGAVEDRKEVEFKGNPDILPEDGSPVAIKFTILE